MKAQLHLFAAALILLTVGHAQPQDVWSQLRETGETTLVVAHRADWRDYPENSLPAIESAIAMGLRMAEIDVRRTQDGEFVLMHDETVDRTTTGHGKVADLTLEQIRQLRLRDGLGSPTSFAVPTLRGALLIARGRILLNLDKSYRHFRELLPILEETGMLTQVLVKGPQPVAEMLAENGDLLSRVPYMPVANFTKPGAMEFVRDWVREARPCAIEFVFADWTPEVAAAFALCRENGVRIWANTLWPQLAGGLSDDQALTDPDGVYGVLLDRGVSIFQTDRPRLLQDYLARRPASAGR
jgi:glycerophosphoryl diester phosphodiesterase